MKNLFKKLNPKTLVQLLIKNTLTQIMVLGSIMIVSSIASPYYEPAYYVMLISIALLTLIAVLYIISAWIINPIRHYFNKKKKK